MENNKVTIWHFVVPALMVACASLIVTCWVNTNTIERVLASNEILIRKNHLLDSSLKASDKEDDSLRNRCDSLERVRTIVCGNVDKFQHDSALYMVMDTNKK